MHCNYCNGNCIKKGFYKQTQRWRCKCCFRYQQEQYVYMKCNTEIEKLIIQLNNEGLSICGMARITGLSKAHIVNKIKQLAARIQKPAIVMGQTYQLDEMRTYIGNKQNTKWIVYAINEKTKAVADFNIGSRNKQTLKRVTDTLLLSKAKTIKTDGLDIYRTLIPKKIHRVKQHGINHIERMNLTLRTKLKRLARKTLCFSKNKIMLESSMKLLIWN